MGRDAREFGDDATLRVDEDEIADGLVAGGLLADEDTTDGALRETRSVERQGLEAGRERVASEAMLRPEEGELQAAVEERRVGLPTLGGPALRARADELRRHPFGGHALESLDDLELLAVEEHVTIDIVCVGLERA